MLAYDYPILGLFWTMLILFLWIAWLMILFRVIIDVFRSADLGGFSKALWTIFVIVLPFLGVFVYLIARGHDMQERSARDAARAQQASEDYIRQVAGSGPSSADELEKLHRLRESGAIDDAEYQQLKGKVLAG
jgi:ABC-type multidrug transport system fused ATPase/permease subunit